MIWFVLGLLTAAISALPWAFGSAWWLAITNAVIGFFAPIVAYTVLVVPYRQRNAAWRELETAPLRLALTTQKSEKIGKRYTWLTKASVRHEMKVKVTNLGRTDEFSARGYWSDNPTGWDVLWHGRAERATRIARDSDASLVVALVGLRRNGWVAFGVFPDKPGPKGHLIEGNADLRIEVRSPSADGPHVTHFRLAMPKTEASRPTLELSQAKPNLDS